MGFISSFTSIFNPFSKEYSVSGLVTTPTPTPTLTPTPSVTPTHTPTPSITPTHSPTPSVTPTQTNTPTPSYTPTNTPTPSITPTMTPTHLGIGGSLVFGGVNQYLTVGGSLDFAFGTGNFTIEWFQYQTSLSTSGNTSTVIDLGTIGNANNTSLVIDSTGAMLVRLANSVVITQDVSSGLINDWNHFALSRSSTSLRLFKNGVQVALVTNSTNISSGSAQLAIGDAVDAEATTRFAGNLTNIHIVKGTALYTSNFTPPTSPIVAVANSKLLLDASTSGTYITDTSGKNKVVTNSSNPVTWSQLNPF